MAQPLHARATPTTPTSTASARLDRWTRALDLDSDVEMRRRVLNDVLKEVLCGEPLTLPCVRALLKELFKFLFAGRHLSRVYHILRALHRDVHLEHAIEAGAISRMLRFLASGAQPEPFVSLFITTLHNGCRFPRDTALYDQLVEHAALYIPDAAVQRRFRAAVKRYQTIDADFELVSKVHRHTHPAVAADVGVGRKRKADVVVVVDDDYDALSHSPKRQCLFESRAEGDEESGVHVASGANPPVPLNAEVEGDAQSRRSWLSIVTWYALPVIGTSLALSAGSSSVYANCAMEYVHAATDSAAQTIVSSLVPVSSALMPPATSNHQILASLVLGTVESACGL